jgi:hypothetical protein
MALEATKETGGTLADVIDRILDKGLVINADIMVSVAGVELLGIRIRAALASFETAAKFGLEFPSGTNMETDAWKKVMGTKQSGPHSEKSINMEKVITTGRL